MRRRDFTMGLLLAATARSVRGEQPARQYRIAIVIPAGPVASIHDPASRYWRPFWEELRRRGDAEGGVFRRGPACGLPGSRSRGHQP